MTTKQITNLSTIIVALILAIIIAVRCTHRNDIQNFQLTQSISGDLEVHSDGGYYFAFFPKKWEYPKRVSVYFSNQKDESKDQDAIVVKFKNKGEGTISCNIIYSLFTDQQRIFKLHEYFGGNMDLLDMKVLSKLRDSIQSCASTINSSEAIENRESFIASIVQKVVGNKELSEMGIELEQIDVTDIDFDQVTKDLFQAQQKADLEKKTAEAERDRAVMEKERVIAKAEADQAEAEGRAKVEMAKETTDAEKKKKLAEIEAEQKVAVAELEKKEATAKAEKEAEVARIEAEKAIKIAELAKQEATVKAEKEKEVAQVEMEIEKIKLETIKVQADQKVAEAEAKKQQIELAGDVTEKEKLIITTEAEVKKSFAAALGEGIGKAKLPNVLIVNNGKNEGKTETASAVDQLLQLMTVEKASQISNRLEK